MKANAPCWCGSAKKFKRCHGDQRRLRRRPVEPGQVSETRPVPDTIERPDYVDGPAALPTGEYQIHSGEALERLRVACRTASEILRTAGEAVAPGVTTDELDRIAHEEYISRGAYPSTLGYRGFPKSICTSVNEVVCHGIPDDRPLQEGDIVNIDVTAYIEGMHGDTSATFAVGELNPQLESLVRLTREATLTGIAAVEPGKSIRVIAEAIEPFAVAHGLGVVLDYGGHGIGRVFHAAPHVNHAINSNDRAILEPGMTFTVEPMITTGTPRHHVWDDRWTVVTDDLLPTAQFEHTVIVTEGGVEILTLGGDGKSPAGPDLPRAALR